MSALLSVCGLLVVTVAAAGSPPAGPAVAVPRLKHAQGVTPETAELLTGALVNKLRETGRFGRVVSSSEIEGMLGYEQQKQLLNCDTGSCMAELAGSLGVDFVLTGSMGRVGSQWLLNLSLMDTHTGQPVSSMTATGQGADEGALLALLERVPSTLLAKLPAVNPGAAPPATPAAPPPPAAAPAAAPPPAESAPRTGGVLGKVLKVAGGVSLAGWALTVPVGLAGGVTAAALWGLVYQDPEFTYDSGLGAPLAAGYYGGLALLGLSILVGLVAAGVGAGALIAGFVL